MIVAHHHSVRRHAAGRQQRANLAEGIRGRARVGGVDRNVRVDGAGSLVTPGLGKIEHVGALLCGEPAAPLPDEDDDRGFGLLDGDRMALAVIGGNGQRRRHLLVMHAGAKRQANADQRYRHRSVAPVGCSGFHGSRIPIPTQSVIKP
jgi:hypothetical protein